HLRQGFGGHVVLVPTSQSLRRGQPSVFFTPRQGVPKRSDGGVVLCSNGVASRSFATGPVDSPPRRINTRPGSKGLHYKGVLDERVRASSTIGQQRGEASHGVHGVHGGEKCSFGFLIYALDKRFGP